MSVVCARCAALQDSTDGGIPKSWRQHGDGFLCPRCAGRADESLDSDVLDEEIIYPPEDMDTLDEGVEDFCEVCTGPCQGH